jgi:hypothetical protein
MFNFQGLIIGLIAFFIIGAFHPLVIIPCRKKLKRDA